LENFFVGMISLIRELTRVTISIFTHIAGGSKMVMISRQSGCYEKRVKIPEVVGIANFKLSFNPPADGDSVERK
jgi:hypothetical protein